VFAVHRLLTRGKKNTRELAEHQCTEKQVE
jgi:hypothetical protein